MHEPEGVCRPFPSGVPAVSEREPGMEPTGPRDIYRKRLDFVEEIILTQLARILEVEEIERYLDDSQMEDREFSLLDKYFSDDAYRAEMKRRVVKLARGLRNRYALHLRKARRGGIDLRRSMQKAFQETGGIPMRLLHKRRVVARPEIVLLCDVSLSVEAFSEFMLLLVYTLQNCFRHVRSFLFVDRIDEVTGYFLNPEVDEAVRSAITHAGYAEGVASDYTRVFELFTDRYLDGVSRRSTVIILGDARNNGLSCDLTFLRKIRDQVKGVLWINPQPREEWDTDDSVIGLFAGCCDQVFECRNLRQLEAVMEEILVRAAAV